MNKEDSEQKNPDIFIIENSPLTQKSKNLKEKKTTKITSPTPKKQLKKKSKFFKFKINMIFKVEILIIYLIIRSLVNQITKKPKV